MKHFYSSMILVAFLYLLSASVLSGFLAAQNHSQHMVAQNQDLKLVSSIQSSAMAADFYVDSGPKLPACPKWCYVDLINSGTNTAHVYLIPKGASDVYKSSLIEKTKENFRTVNSETLINGCMYIRFDPNETIKSAHFIELDNTNHSPEYEVAPSIVSNPNENDIVVDNVPAFFQLMKDNGTSLQEMSINGTSGILLATSGQFYAQDGSIASTVPNTKTDELRFTSVQPAGDQKIGKYTYFGSRGTAHELVAHVISDYAENPSGKRDSSHRIMMTETEDRHTKDSHGNDLPSDNVARQSKTGNMGMKLNDDQIAMMKKMCDSSEFAGQDHSPPDTTLFGRQCGDGVCSPNENSYTCQRDCGKAGSGQGCQWISGKQDNSDGSKVCGGACQNSREVCNSQSKKGQDCGCHLCGNGTKDPGEECESAKDCPTHVDSTVSCVNCQCIYKQSRS